MADYEPEPFPERKHLSDITEQKARTQKLVHRIEALKHQNDPEQRRLARMNAYTPLISLVMMLAAGATLLINSWQWFIGHNADRQDKVITRLQDTLRRLD